MKKIKILEQICDRILKLKKGATNKRFLAAADAMYVRYSKELDKELNLQALEIVQYKLKDLTDKLNSQQL